MLATPSRRCVNRSMSLVATVAYAKCTVVRKMGKGKLRSPSLCPLGEQNCGQPSTRRTNKWGPRPRTGPREGGTYKIHAFMRITLDDKKIQMAMMGAGCILGGTAAIALAGRGSDSLCSRSSRSALNAASSSSE